MIVYIINCFTVAGLCWQASWTVSENMHGSGGNWSAAGSTLDTCKQTCYANISCSGFDWDPTNPSNQYCWLFTSEVYLEPATNVNHYEKNSTCIYATSGKQEQGFITEMTPMSKLSFITLWNSIRLIKTLLIYNSFMICVCGFFSFVDVFLLASLMISLLCVYNNNNNLFNTVTIIEYAVLEKNINQSESIQMVTIDLNF